MNDRKNSTRRSDRGGGGEHASEGRLNTGITRERLSGAKRLLFAALTGLTALAAAEVALRLGGVTFLPRAITLAESENREIVNVVLDDDPEVQWVVTPSSLAGTPLAVNAHGMRGPDRPEVKPAGCIRILCMGDSCTFGARVGEPYPLILEALCRERLGRNVEVLNGGVPGHAAHQGEAMLQRFLAFKPDVVTFYYGWNDHWRRTPALVGPDIHAPPATDSILLLRGLRMAWRYRRARGQVDREESTEQITDTEVRLPPNHYRAMLDKFAELGEQHSFTPVFMTAPSAFNEENLRHMVDLGWAVDTMRIRARHDRYIEITREMARTKVVPLVDLVAHFTRRGGEPLIHSDGIHPTQEGHRLIAEALFTTVAPIIRSR